MAQLTIGLDVTIGRNLPLDDCDLVFASTDSVGTPGTLNTSVLAQLGMSREVLKRVSKQLGKGFAIESRDGGQTLALVVTVGRPQSGQILEKNITRLLSGPVVSKPIAAANSVWLPLMGVGAGRLSFEESLRITIRAITASYAAGNLMWRRLVLSIGSEASGSMVEKLAREAEQLFADGHVPVSISMVAREYNRTIDDQQEIIDPPPSREIHEATERTTAPTPDRDFDDDLEIQIDAPEERPQLRFVEMATGIVAVVEDVVRPDALAAQQDGNAVETRRRDWLSASEARLTIGIFAPWGAGKSTLIGALRSEFLKREYAVFSVNPWKWNGSGDLHDHVRATVIEQAGQQRGVPMLLAWLKWRTCWRKYGRLLWWFAVVAAAIIVFYRPIAAFVLQIGASDDLVGGIRDLAKKATPAWLVPAIVAALPGIWKFFGGWLGKLVEKKLFNGVPDKLGADGLSLVYRDIASLIYRRGRKFRPFVFFFDDLDRCTPERVAAVLESVHSLTAAGCVVFLACDDEYLVAALNAHYAKVATVYGDGKIFGRRYLDKIVQIPFRLPLLKNNDVFELGLARVRSEEQADYEPTSPLETLPQTQPEKYVDLQKRVLRGSASDADQKRLKTYLQEIIGDLLGKAVEPLGLNVRQAKSISNILKLYLRIQECKTEKEACQLAAFVFANCFDEKWLDGHYHGIQVSDSPIGAAHGLAEALKEMIGNDQAHMLQSYHLLGRRPKTREQVERKTHDKVAAA
jgi:hypothetical protein